MMLGWSWKRQVVEIPFSLFSLYGRLFWPLAIWLFVPGAASPRVRSQKGSTQLSSGARSACTFSASVLYHYIVNVVVQILFHLLLHLSVYFIPITHPCQVPIVQTSTHAATPNRFLMTALTTFLSPWWCWRNPALSHVTCKQVLHIHLGDVEFLCSHGFAAEEVVTGRILLLCVPQNSMGTPTWKCFLAGITVHVVILH